MYLYEVFKKTIAEMAKKHIILLQCRHGLSTVETLRHLQWHNI